MRQLCASAVLLVVQSREEVLKIYAHAHRDNRPEKVAQRAYIGVDGFVIGNKEGTPVKEKTFGHFSTPYNRNRVGRMAVLRTGLGDVVRARLHVSDRLGDSPNLCVIKASATLQHYEEESSQPAATASLQTMRAGPKRGQKEQRRCYICDRPGHLAARCWQAKQGEEQFAVEKKKRKSRQSGTEKAMNSDAPQQHHSEEEKSKGEKRSMVERMKSTSDVTEVAVRSYGKDEKKESRSEPGTKSPHTSSNGGGASLRAAQGGMMKKRNDLEAKNEKVTRPPEGEERVAYLSASDVQVAQAESRRTRDSRQGNEEKKDKKSSLEHTLLTATEEYGGAKVRVLFDSGASHNFIAQRVVERMQLRTKPSAQVKSVTLADGRVVEATGRVTEMLPLRVGTVEAHVSCIVFHITGKMDIVLGKEFLTRYNPLIDFRKNDLTFVTERGEVTVNAAGPSPQMTASSAEVDMNIIDSVEARQLIAQGCELFSVWVEEEPVEERGGATLSSMAATDPVLNASQQQQIEAVLKEFADVIPDELPSHLPPKREVDHRITIEPGAKPARRPPFRLAQPELDELHKQLTVLLDKGLIVPGTSPYGAPVFFVKKKDGGLRAVCDYRQLNAITVKESAALPLVDDLFDSMRGSKFFSKLDLHSGYHQNQIRMHEDDVEKTAIVTPFGTFMWRVLPMGLTNAPVTFNSLMQSIMQPFLRKFVAVFLDDVLIYSRTWEEHLSHVSQVLTVLRKHELYCKPSKCVFGTPSVGFLGHRVTGTTLTVDDDKVQAVKEWPTPSDIRSQCETVSWILLLSETICGQLHEHSTST